MNAGSDRERPGIGLSEKRPILEANTAAGTERSAEKAGAGGSIRCPRLRYSFLFGFLRVSSDHGILLDQL